jgi:type IV pilus assembly protein PilV
MSAARSKPATARQRGFTLIEALVTFVILSIGLLGIVSMQGLAKSSLHQSVQRSRAVSLADSIVERVRINPAGMATYNIGLSPVGAGTPSPEPSPNCSSASCDALQLATRDLWEWETALRGATVIADGANAAGLIEPRGCIQFDPMPGMTGTGRLTVIIQWQGLVETMDAVQAGEPVCGGKGAGQDRFRRQVVVNTFVADPVDL